MPRPLQPHGGSAGRRWRRWTVMSAAGLAGFAVAAIAGIAFAKTFTLTIAKNVKVKTKHESIVANSKGVALYYLSGETPHHLLCTGPCLPFWPPLTVASAHAKLTKQPGIKGKLSKMKRGKAFQVVLNGHPLYRFKEDNNKAGVANGEGIKLSSTAIWHVIPASGKLTTGGTGTTTTMPCYYPPCY